MPDKLFLIRDSFNVKIKKVRTKNLQALRTYEYFVYIDPGIGKNNF